MKVWGVAWPPFPLPTRVPHNIYQKFSAGSNYCGLFTETIDHLLKKVVLPNHPTYTGSWRQSKI